MILPHSRHHELCDCIVAISFLRIHVRISRQRLEGMWTHVQSMIWSPSTSLLEKLRNSRTKPSWRNWHDKTKTWWAGWCWLCPPRAISPRPCFKHLHINPLLMRKYLCTVQEPAILWESRNNELTRDRKWNRFILRCDNCVKDPKCCSDGGLSLVAQVTACPSHLRMRVWVSWALQPSRK